MPVPRYLPAVIAAGLIPVPAYAAGGIPLPEPSSLFLFGMGVVGVAIGRKLSSRRGED